MTSRNWDRFFIVTALFLTWSSFANEAMLAIVDDIHSTTGPWTWAARTYSQIADPLVGANPPFMQTINVISGYVYGPITLAIAYGFYARKRWVQPLALIHAGALLTMQSIYAFTDYFGPMPPTNVAIFIGANLLHWFYPIAIFIRFWGPDAFPAVSEAEAT